MEINFKSVLTEKLLLQFATEVNYQFGKNILIELKQYCRDNTLYKKIKNLIDRSNR